MKHNIKSLHTNTGRQRLLTLASLCFFLGNWLTVVIEVRRQEKYFNVTPDVVCVWVCVSMQTHIYVLYTIYMYVSMYVCIYIYKCQVHGFVFSRLLGTLVSRHRHLTVSCEKNSLHTAEEQSHYLNCKTSFQAAFILMDINVTFFCQAEVKLFVLQTHSKIEKVPHP